MMLRTNDGGKIIIQKVDGRIRLSVREKKPYGSCATMLDVAKTKELIGQLTAAIKGGNDAQS